MSLAKISIQRPVFAWMLMAALILFGLVSWKQMGVSQLPDVDFPVVNVSLSLDGASPEVIESDVVDILESAFIGLSGLKKISSSSRFGGGSINLEFDIDRDIDFAVQEVQSRISQNIRRLPKDLEPPNVSKTNPEDQPIMWLGFSGNLTQRELMIYARDKILNLIQMIEGVGDVQLGGFITPNIRVWLDPEKLIRYELSVDDVIGAIGREHVELPAGSFTGGSKEYNLRIKGEAASPEELSRVSISRRGGGINYSPVKLSDLGRVEAGLEDNRVPSRVMGTSAVGIGIRKMRGTNAVDVADRVIKRMEEINKELPSGLKLGVNFNSTKFIKNSIRDLQHELLVSVLLTSIVCFLFLGSFSSTFNVILAIPTSLIGTLTVLYFAGFTLNTFTLLGITLAVGIVVDDAIMVLENIVRHRELGLNKEKASLVGTEQIQFAALAATLAIVAIFLPVAFMKGVIGKFFLEFGVTISVAVMISLLEALTLTPMRSSQFLYVPGENGKRPWLDGFLEFLVKHYKTTLKLALNWKWSVIVFSVLFFVSSLFLLKGIKKEFVPAQDQSFFLVRLSTPTGSSLDFTDQVFAKAEGVVKGIPEVIRYFVSVGGFGGNSLNTGIMFITLKDLKDRTRSQFEVMDEVRAKLNAIPDLKAVAQDLSARGFGGGRSFPIEFSVTGPDWEKLVTISQEIQNKLSEDGRFKDVDSNYEEGTPELQIIPNRQKALELGVSVEDIGRVIRQLVGGANITRFTENGRRIDVRVRLIGDYRKTSKDILKLFVRNNRGELIPLKNLVSLQEKTTLVSITRKQRERSITITSNIADKASQADMMTFVESLGAKLPSGYSVVRGGNSEAMKESFSGLIFALWMGVLVAYMILASQFNSFIHPFTVLLALPFSLSGAWIALKVMDQGINIYSMIGFILLMGIVKKNSIMLVDFTNQMREQGKSVAAALIEACPLRLRPILMTSITVITAALPSVFGIGEGTETRLPMSLAVIGGVMVSTLFTLYVVPCAYLVFSKLELKKAQANLEL